MYLILLLGIAGTALMVGGLGGGGDDSDSGKDIDGTDGDDNLTGTQGDDSILAGDGHDIVRGLNGDDFIDLGLGDDRGYGGAGDDVMRGDDGDDQVVGGQGDDTLFLGDGVDTNAGDDVISYLSGKSSYYEGLQDLDLVNLKTSTLGGNDTVIGGPGTDLILDFHGTNTLNGNSDDDFISSVDAAGSAQSSDTVNGGFGADYLSVDDGDTVTGDDGMDTFDIWVDEFDDEPVVITDYVSGEELLLTLDPDTFGAMALPTPEVTAIPGENALSVKLAGQEIVIIQGITDPNLVSPHITVWTAP
ncbi:calcium-binding protein [Actibacterium sp. XHP0104]|uniref:calcium-binding protein n=1 Tax=Actibacterium sp. XHP0104 TaxID=2984335 RepID=UPI0021E95865|nr:calcium-binding protein [Actibacterium sp. XHP0104]MCV2882865.1 hypothetical protein [Actibacterium sp. XHP0104]